MRKRHTAEPVEVDSDADEEDLKIGDSKGVSQVQLSSSDWTAEVVVSQIQRENIQLTPRFQRRDAWGIDRKSKLIESLIIGLPVPQIVLAENKGERGKFLVLDGKQRLLTLLQYWGLATSSVGNAASNAFSLTGLPERTDLNGLTFEELKSSEHRDDFDALCNSTIRTVVIKNWKDTDFLHMVFLRLNTGSVNLSPQELRQALIPGGFSDFVDDAAGESAGLREILGVEGPDPRMRDIEILARYLAFRFFAKDYPGRLKKFLDDVFEEFNSRWSKYKTEVEGAVHDFEKGVQDLVEIFGAGIARKPDSRQFNRAIFDALIYFQSNPSVRKALKGKHKAIIKGYEQLCNMDSEFLSAVERDTAGAPNTKKRFEMWADVLSEISGKRFQAPRIPTAGQR